MKNDPLLMEIQDEISRENMVKFVNKYAKLLVAGAILLFIGVAAFQFWQQYHKEESIKTGAVVYNVLVNADKKPDEFALKNLEEASKTSGYYEISLLNKAQLQVKANDFTGAIDSFDTIAKNAGNKPLRDLASLNAANLLLNNNPKADGLEKRLTDISVEDNSYKYNSRELLATYYIQNGHNDKATEVLSKLAKDQNTPVTIAKRARELLAEVSIGADNAAENEED